LALPARARKYFERRKHIERPAAAAKLTLGELANTRGLGVGSIVEIVEALYRCAEARGFKPPPPASKRTKRTPRPPLHAPRSLGRQTTRAGRIPSALRGCRLPPLPAEAKLADLRLRGRARRFLQQGAYLADRAALSKLTIAELLDHIGLGEGTVIELVNEFYRCADDWQRNVTLDEEVLGWLVPRGQPLRRELVARRFGLGGRRSESLRGIGESCGYTRERIRQLCTPRSAPPTTLLRRYQTIVEAVRALLPAPATEIEAHLVERGLLAPGTKLEAMLRVAALLDREAGFLLKGEGVNRLAAAPLAAAVEEVRKLLVRLSHALPVMHALHLQASWHARGKPSLDSATLEQAIEATPQAQWLDQTQGWLWLDRGGTALRYRIEKTLAAADRLTVAELQAAVWRGPRTKYWPQPPLSVLLELCRRLPECRVEQEFIRASDPTRSFSRLVGEERKLVEYLLLRGQPCGWEELKEFFDSQGTGQARRWQLLSGSSAVKRYGQGLYGTPGLDVR
jgi:hypothetical protein